MFSMVDWRISPISHWKRKRMHGIASALVSLRLDPFAKVDPVIMYLFLLLGPDYTFQYPYIAIFRDARIDQ